MAMSDAQTDGYTEKTVAIDRHSKVVKGGRKFSFSALVVVGDEKGKVGFGRGSAPEVPSAIQKASQAARKNIVKIDLYGTTIQHEMIATHGASKVFMKPASEGTGILAGGAMRAVFEVLGVKNVLAKCIGSTTPVNVIRATLNGLTSMASPQSIAAKRGKTVKEVLGINND